MKQHKIQQTSTARNPDSENPNIMKVTMNRKRSRLGLATIAVALSVSAVSAFQSALPSTRNSPLSGPQQPSPSRLSVVTDPETLLMENLDSLYGVEIRPAPSISRQRPSKNGSQKVKQRNAPQVAAIDEEILAAKVTKGTRTTSLPPRQRIKKKRSPHRSSTMPGFQSGGSMSGRQKAFRDGIKMVEGRTGKKLAKYVDTPAERKKRRQVNGEAMYKGSASVPDSLVQFASEIHKVDRITPKEEIELGEKTQEAIRLQSLHEDLSNRLNRPPTDDEWCAAAGKINLEAISQAIEEGLEAKNKLVTSNLRMVQGVVNLYIRNGLGGQYNAGDLMQEGIMALIRAAEKFDPSRGFRFSTYAMYWIRSSVKRSQIVQSRVVTIPQRLYENHKRIQRTDKELQGLLGRKPTRKELGEAVGMSELQVERCITAMKQRVFSLDQGIQNNKKPMSGDKGADTMIDLIDSRTDDGEYNTQRRILMREDLIATLRRHLTPEEVELLLLRYGLKDDLPAEYGFGPMTIASVSRIVGLKPDKVRRMINKSIKDLQVIIGEEWMDYEHEFQQ